jgi:hypothetical protein
MSGLVDELEKPTLWTEGEGRWMDAGITEVVSIDSRGSRVGMYSKTYCPVLETRLRGWRRPPTVAYKETKAQGCERESEGFIVLLESEGQHNPGRGKGPYFVHATKERRIRGLPCC